MGIYFLVAGGTVALLFPWSLVSTIVKRARPMLAGPWRYELTDNGMRIDNPLGTCEMTWQNLVGRTDHSDFWLVHTPIKGQSLIVVKSAFAVEDQQTIADQLSRITCRTSARPNG